MSHKRVGRAIVLFAMAALTGWVEFNSIRAYLRDRTAASWQSTQGTIESLERCTPVHECGLRYTYSVDGKDYVGRRIGFSVANLPKGWGTVDYMAWAADTFPDGKSVTVFYDSASPETSALQVGMLPSSYLWHTVLSGILIAALLFFGARSLMSNNTAT